ncbi:MAG: TetR/AcrR family transcriptional regulator [Steroidobacteraceae bacterium]
MSSRETQALIKDGARTLFNARGTAHVSTNAIAKHCGISKGNLHYHYPTKQELILALHQDIAAEMEASWRDDSRQPTVTHMAEMFTRHFGIIRHYRFFYREMAALTAQNAKLRRSLRDARRRRIAAVVAFFEALVEAGVLARPRSRHSLRHLVIMTWILCDNWWNFVEMEAEQTEGETVQNGYDIIIEVLYPYLTERARDDIYASYTALLPEPGGDPPIGG